MNLLIGQTILHYRIIDKLGQGGMGEVYRAVDVRLDRPVALKVLPAEAIDRADWQHRFVREAKAASALNHPNIITIYDVGAVDDVSFIAMEYVSGRTLQEVIGGRGLPLPEALRYAEQIADALAAAHSAGIVHRDLKPANIMLNEQGRVKVLDFGLAKHIIPLELTTSSDGVTTHLAPAGSPELTQDGVIVGTVAYMSPEQAQGKPLDARSDVFAFGVVLHEMIAGQRPFRGDSTLTILSAVLQSEPPLLSELRTDVTPEIDRLVGRCLRKDPERRPQNMRDIRLALEELRIESSVRPMSRALPAPAGVRRPRRAIVILGSVVAATLLAGAAGWMMLRKTGGPAPQPRVMTKLTSDPGLSGYPALSPDGNLLAYASDRAAAGNLDIWIRQVQGGDPIRLTTHAADDYEPAFSPDSTMVAFRSERDGGGIYVVQALGGNERPVVAGGRRPRFSPDGKLLAYWVGPTGSSGAVERIYLVPVAGGAPRPWKPDVAAASHPVWSPDGKHILFWGKQDRKTMAPESSEWWTAPADWWVAPVDGGPTVNARAFATLGADAFANTVIPGFWTADGAILFSMRAGDSTNVWRVPMSARTLAIAGPSERQTSGTGLEVQPSAAADGRLVFASLAENLNIWSLPMDASRGRVTGDIQRLTNDAAVAAAPSVSADGSVVAFLSNRLGTDDVWVLDLRSGQELRLTQGNTPKRFPIISPDGARVAFGMIENDKQAIYAVATLGGVAERLCDDCGLPRSWSADGSAILYQSGNPSYLSVLDVTTRTRTEALRHPKYGLFSARISPDGLWIVFFQRIETGLTQIAIAPFRAGRAVRSDEWVPVTSGEFEDDKPRWSPDGNSVYFTSLRDGFRCVWSQRLEPRTKRPIGQVSAVRHFHQARLSMMNVELNRFELSIARDKAVFSLAERTGNIWMSSPGAPP